MSELRTQSQFLHAKFTQLRNVPNEVNWSFATMIELYVQTCFYMFLITELQVFFVNIHLVQEKTAP